MKDSEIIDLGKAVFGVFFSIGTLCLLGALITKNNGFAGAGYLLIVFGVPVNLLCILGFLTYGVINTSKFKECMIAILILTANIPIAFLYALIGLSFFNN
jgi:LIVCS family branched-chain amino acid:cation transporter